MSAESVFAHFIVLRKQTGHRKRERERGGQIGKVSHTLGQQNVNVKVLVVVKENLFALSTTMQSFTFFS